MLWQLAKPNSDVRTNSYDTLTWFVIYRWVPDVVPTLSLLYIMRKTESPASTRALDDDDEDYPNQMYQSSDGAPTTPA